MQILPYNRVIKDLNDLSPRQFFARLAETFDVTPNPASCKPAAPGEFGMIVDGKWYRLHIRDKHVVREEPMHRLDTMRLQDLVLAPILGITDARTDRRIEFIGGIDGVQRSERRIIDGEAAVAFTLYPTSLSELMSIADIGQMMPPKSTWFEPKLADGLVSYVLD
jgi:uncharacterized protein (DUF1015 family)